MDETLPAIQEIKIEKCAVACNQTFSLKYGQLSTAFLPQNVNATTLENALNDLGNIKTKGRVTVESDDDAHNGSNLFRVTFNISDPRTAFLLECTYENGGAPFVNITTVREGRSSKDFTLNYGGVVSSPLKPDSSLSGIKAAFKDMFSTSCTYAPKLSEW